MSDKFINIAEYSLALLQLLADEGPLPTRAALAAFEKRFGDRIPKKMYGIIGNEIKWANRVRWGRLNLARLGLMGKDQRGIWCLSERGRQFLLDYPDDILQQLNKLIAIDAKQAKEERQKRQGPSSKKISKSSVSKSPKRDTKTSKKSTGYQLPSSISHEDPAIWSACQKLTQEIRIIRDYLNGVSSSQPTNELICDWVHFCYSYELYAEGLELFTLAGMDGVNPWYYERARKMARLCAIKVKEQ